jgi:hypothetical protein
VPTELVPESEGLLPPWVVGFDEVQVRHTAVAFGQHVQAAPRSLVQLWRHQLPAHLGEDRGGWLALHQ